MCGIAGVVSNSETAFDKANTGLVVLDGKLIEKPVLREMRRILKIAARALK